jgi:ketosteroid isomerase-like protein
VEPGHALQLHEILRAVGSEANVETLRWLYGEWAKGNLWALREVADPSIEWEWAGAFADLAGGPRVCRGLEEIGAATLEWLDTWDSYWMTADEFIDTGDRIVVPMRLHARTRGTDRVIEQPLTAVWTLRDGRAVAVRYYEDADQALRAGGLSDQATVRENVAIVRSIYAAWERGDFSSAEWAHPEIELIYADGPDPGSWRGSAEMAKALRNILSAWEGVRAEADEYRELDAERVLVLDRRSARGKRSGLEIEQMLTEGAVVFHIRDAKVVRLLIYWDRERGLADLGLASESSSPRS